jgi:hypothetical protein
MSAYYVRCRDTHRESFLSLLLAWLATLPGEWEGTAGDLEPVLDEFAATRRDYRERMAATYAGAGLSGVLATLSPRIEAAGWRVGWRRTAQARLIRFTRGAR